MMEVLFELVFFVVIGTVALVGLAVWVVIKILWWLASTIWAAIKPALEELWEEIQEAIEEAQKPTEIRAAGQKARQQMTIAADRFVAETTEFLQDQGVDGSWQGE
jgi:membrane protein implicated in regulation of membrane protease activity